MPGVELQQKIEAAIRESLERTFGNLREEVTRRLRNSQEDVLGYLTTVDFSATLPPLPAELLAPPPPDRAPALLATLVDGARRLDAGRTQAAILRSLLSASGRHASRAAIFLANKDGVRLWESEGFSRAPRIGAIPIGEIAAFDDARNGRGSLRLSSEATAAIGERLGAEPARDAVLVPLVLRDQIASFLYADQLEPSDDFAPEALQLLTYVAALSLETLAFRKRERTPTLVPFGEKAAQGLSIWETASPRLPAVEPARPVTAAIPTASTPPVEPAAPRLEASSPRTAPIPVVPAPAAPSPVPALPLNTTAAIPAAPPAPPKPAEPSTPFAPLTPITPVTPIAPPATTSTSRVPTGSWTVIEPSKPAPPVVEPATPRFSFDSWNVAQPASEEGTATNSTGAALPALPASPKGPSRTPAPPATPVAPPTPARPSFSALDSPSFDESLPSLGEGFGTVRIPRASELFRNVREPEASPAPPPPASSAPVSVSTAKIETAPAIPPPRPSKPLSGASTANLDVSEDETLMLPDRGKRAPEPASPSRDDVRHQTAPFALPNLSTGTASPAPPTPSSPMRPPVADLSMPPSAATQRIPSMPSPMPPLPSPSPTAPTSPAPRAPLAPSSPTGAPTPATETGPGAGATKPRQASGSEVVPPENLRGPGLAFAGARASGESPAHDEARRLARLLVSEIKLYNEEQVDLGRKNLDLYQRLREDIDRSRQMYADRVDATVRGGSDYFQQELVRILAGGDPKALGT